MPDEHQPGPATPDVAAFERAGRDRLAARDELEGLRAEVATLRAALERTQVEHARRVRELEAELAARDARPGARLRRKAGAVARRLRD
ncbi:hypothetical protein [Nocardioides nitrophenolicus]|uniref:hypothetical protein n=1 Tax=Nocardioides nitrophenolicus TaxID=60489 RepID=UPI001959DAF0|nr:hypothetical protein [Nocardioides nitrophenolicus]MBM7519555.1 septal ring factor EnvC (AmiA/AmiB activator) [Nocardioides nitrophenolicus]